jgi:hypothetical protein
MPKLYNIYAFPYFAMLYVFAFVGNIKGRQLKVKKKEQNIIG